MLNHNYIKKVAVFFLGVLVLMMLSTGCTKVFTQQTLEKVDPIHPKDAKREIILSKAQNKVVVYFTTADKMNLVPVTFEVNPTEEMAKVSTEKLLGGPSDQFLDNVIPDGTKLKDLYKFDNIAYVDLTKEFLSIKSDIEAAQAVNALVFTLTEFSQVGSVQILIDGKVPEKSYGGIDITKSLHRPEKINFYGHNGKNKYRVYYYDVNAMYMVPVTFATDREVSPEMVVEKLLQNPPKESKLGASPIWKGTKLLGVGLMLDTANVNLSKEALAYGGGAAAEGGLVNSLTLSLTELPNIKKIQLLIEGKKPEYLPEGTDISQPWERPEKINFIQR